MGFLLGLHIIRVFTYGVHALHNFLMIFTYGVCTFNSDIASPNAFVLRKYAECNPSSDKPEQPFRHLFVYSRKSNETLQIPVRTIPGNEPVG